MTHEDEHQRRDQETDAEKTRDLPDPHESPDDRPDKVSEIRREQEQLDPNRRR
jgi:hypothetical protein